MYASLFSAMVLFLISCSPSTQIAKSWKDPSVTAATVKPFKKVLVVAQLHDESTRRIAEDKFAAQFPAGVGVQSYGYLKPQDSAWSSVEQRLKNDGFDGVVSISLSNVDKSTSYVPGSSYGGWYGYRYSASPGYYQEDKTYYVETNFYSLESGKLMWSGTTSTMNPSKVSKTIDDIIVAIKGQLQKEGLLK